MRGCSDRGTHSPPAPREQGAALVSAMLIVSLMAVVALSLVESVRFASRLSLNLEAREQAQLYAVGAEQLARGSVRSFWVAGQDRQPALEAWLGQPFYFPIEGGAIQGEAKDGANCFNLNSLVASGEDGAQVANEATQAEFVRLMGHLDVIDSEAQAIATATTDWIDSDSDAGFSGAEDDYYGALEPPFRTAGGLMVEPSEIRRIRGMTGDIYTRLRPFICTRPSLEPSRLNLNTLRDWQLPLVAAILGEETDISDAESLLGERPAGGFMEAREFRELDSVAAMELEDAVLERFGVQSDYVDLSVQVRYRKVYLNMVSSLQIGETGDMTTLSRRYGSVE